MNTEATSSQPELPIDTVDFIKWVVTLSNFQPNATPDMVTSVAQVSPHRYDFGALDCYRAITTSGLDLIVTEMPRDRYWDSSDPELNETTEWQLPTTETLTTAHASTKATLSDGYYLEGLLEQRWRTLDLEEGRFTIKLMTGPDRFNNIMAALGRQPGVDCFRLTPFAGGQFSARSLVEAAARFEIPLAMDEALYVEHDRKLDDHVQAWWSMPPELVLRLQERANEVLASNDDNTIVSFADGLDLMSSLSKLIVPVASQVLDDAWEDSDTVKGRQRQLLDFVADLAGRVGVEVPAELGETYNISAHYHANKACVALIETGLLPDIPLSEPDTYSMRHAIFPSNNAQDSPETLKAREAVAYWSLAIMRNSIDMLSRASQIQHQPTNRRRDDLIQRIAA